MSDDKIVGWWWNERAFYCTAHKPSPPDDALCTPLMASDCDGEICDDCGKRLDSPRLITRILGWLSGWWRGFCVRHLVAPDPAEAALDRAFEAARKPEMPELADTHYSISYVWEYSNGNVAFFATDHAQAAAYLICRSAREAVS